MVDGAIVVVCIYKDDLKKEEEVLSGLLTVYIDVEVGVMSAI